MLPPSSTSSSSSSSSSTNQDKSKDWQLELLMEKLRTKTVQFKTFVETSKNVRMAMLDKRNALDSIEKSQHQKCLDTLQQSIKVTSLQRMVEKLKCLTRQLGLKFVVGQSGVELFISTDMFYLEIILDQSGAVKDVKVHHETTKVEQSCPELVSCLSNGDFADFTAQLEGFASIYQLNAEKKIKSKAFTALQSLEADLSTLAQLQTFMKEPFNLLHKSPVGILEQRRGGHPMKLTYFVSPYDLIDVEKYDIDPINVETITSKSLGYSVTVCMEGSAAHKLQTTTLITVNRNVNGKNTPSFTPFNSQNSAAIPACFVLKLNKPMPMCVTLLREIQQLTELEIPELASTSSTTTTTTTATTTTPTTHPLLSLIASHASNGKLEAGNNKGLFVTLPDQSHCYFLTENRNMEGILVNSIPFTHPCHVSRILIILRQQALFNTIITSCVRQNSKQDLENMIIFEVSALSWTHISISLEHPVEENMATAEIDLTDISNLTCKIHSPGTPPPPNTPDVVSELATKVLNRSFSIPITMRAVIKHWDKQVVKKNHYNGHENFSLPLGSGDPGGHKGPSSGGSLTEFGGLDGKIKQEPSGNGMNLQMMSSHHHHHHHHQQQQHHGIFLEENVLSNMELTNILQGTDNTKSSSANKRQHKRKASDDLWKSSTKRKATSEEASDLLLETSSSDSTSRSTPLSQETVSEIATPNSALGFHSDLELSGLDPAELIGGGDKSSGEFDELSDVEEMLAKSGRKPDKSSSPAGLLMDLSAGDNKVAPSVSITPIPASSPNYKQNMRSGIEIIPITSAASLPSSITITPIAAKEERTKEKKSSKNRSDDKNRLEKKKKRRREETAMGPPDKLPLKQQDPLTKPVTVSIKATESPTSPSMMRKFTPSPTQTRPSGKLSPSTMLKSSRHSNTLSNSPKHTAISSPKGTSPSTSGGASGGGKPSMSALKNAAANSPSSNKSGGESKTTNKISLNKDSSTVSKDKDKKLSSAFNCSSAKVKSSSVKVKQLDSSGIEFGESVQETTQTNFVDGGKTAMGQVKNRKGNLLAVIDKLKSAQHCETPADLSSKSSSRSQISNKTSELPSSKTTIKTGETKNSEYMVKPSSDGMKITINKTRTKDSSGAKTTVKSGSGSPKTHTGLKPGVSSGPASKKPLNLNQKLGPNAAPFKSSSKSTNSNVKTSTLNKSSSKLGSPKMNSTTATDLSRKQKLSKSSSEKSIFTMKEGRKSSPTPNKDETDYKATSYSSPLMMEGLMKQQFDKNFQIPKLSARMSDDKKLKINSTDNNVKSGDVKYPLSLPAATTTNDKLIKNNILPAATTNTSVLNVQTSTANKDDFDNKPAAKTEINYSITNKSMSEPLSLSTKPTTDTLSKFIAPAAPIKDDRKEKSLAKSDSELLLDYSSKSGEQQQQQQQQQNKANASSPYPQSPSVSVHIVKSPAPSPLINPSPHSTSPSCITDDELMDEALVGLGK